jgi:GT2 family glycosyltransferase
MNFYIVVVLYRIKLEESQTIISFSNYSTSNFDILVYDNSPEKQYENCRFRFKNLNIDYVHDESNPGLSHAYNYALSNAFINKFNWLLLLDQDTSLTNDYLEEIVSLNLTQRQKDFVCVIPNVRSIGKNTIISPSKFLMGGICRPIVSKPGVTCLPITGINSGTILNVNFMNSINGFNSDFKLDMLDHWYFREISKKKQSILLLKSTIYQNLSIFEKFEENMSLARYKNLLIAESRFIKDDKLIGLCVYKFRLLIRSFVQLNYNNKEYFKITLNHLLGTSFYK